MVQCWERIGFPCWGTMAMAMYFATTKGTAVLSALPKELICDERVL